MTPVPTIPVIMETGIVEGAVISIKHSLIRVEFDKIKCRPDLGVTLCEGDNEISFVLSKEGAELLIDNLRDFFGD